MKRSASVSWSIVPLVPFILTSAVVLNLRSGLNTCLKIESPKSAKYKSFGHDVRKTAEMAFFLISTPFFECVRFSLEIVDITLPLRRGALGCSVSKRSLTTCLEFPLLIKSNVLRYEGLQRAREPDMKLQVSLLC